MATKKQMNRRRVDQLLRGIRRERAARVTEQATEQTPNQVAPPPDRVGRVIDAPEVVVHVYDNATLIFVQGRDTLRVGNDVRGPLTVLLTELQKLGVVRLQVVGFPTLQLQ